MFLQYGMLSAGHSRNNPCLLRWTLGSHWQEMVIREKTGVRGVCPVRPSHPSISIRQSRGLSQEPSALNPGMSVIAIDQAFCHTCMLSFRASFFPLYFITYWLTSWVLQVHKSHSFKRVLGFCVCRWRVLGKIDIGLTVTECSSPLLQFQMQTKASEEVSLRWNGF